MKIKNGTKSKPRTYLLLRLSNSSEIQVESRGEEKNRVVGREKKFVADSSSFSPIALTDVDGHVASDDFLRHPRQRLCLAGSGFGHFKRWEWIWTLLKSSRCMVSFPQKCAT